MKKKVLLSSCLSILLCLCLIAGSTYALFTSKKTVDVSVTSATVELTAVVNPASLKLYSKNVLQDETFENKGTAALTNGNATLTLTNVAPGDRAEFNLVVTNSSTIAIQYRITWYVDGELAGGLIAKADNATLVNGTTDWTSWTTDMASQKTIPVSVELPLEAGNEYQTKTASITFTVEAVQANGTAEYDAQNP